MDGFASVPDAGDGHPAIKVEPMPEVARLRRYVLRLGGRLNGFDHTLSDWSEKPSDPDDVRWECLCGYAGAPGRVMRHWEANLIEYEAALR